MVGSGSYLVKDDGSSPFPDWRVVLMARSGLSDVEGREGACWGAAAKPPG